MAITFSLGFVPKWILIDKNGQTAGGGWIRLWSSLNRVVPKQVFQDPSGLIPWPVTSTNQLLFDEDGTQGPFYFLLDSANPSDLYFIEAFDSQGIPLWTMDQYFPSGGGGGGSITEFVQLKNYIINNVFYRNSGTINPLPQNAKLSPGYHGGIVTSLTPLTKPVFPDITFFKDSAVSTDQINFVPFGLNNDPFSSGNDVTPEFYLNFQCTAAPGGETLKCLVFPVVKGIKNLEGQQVSIRFWAQSVSNPQNLLLQWYQFYGEGSTATAPILTPIQSFTLTPSVWNSFSVTATVPTQPGGATLGQSGTDALFLLVCFPVNLPCQINFTKLSLYLGTNFPPTDFDSYDQIDSLINTPRTGDIRTSLNDFQPFGWVAMNDGTIGDSMSNAVTRANIDTFPLYSMIWNAMQAIQQYAPMYTSAGTPVAYGANPVADFSAHNQISLTKSLGQVLAGATPVNVNNASQVYTVNIGVSNNNLNVATNAVSFGTGTPVVIANTGGAPPTGLTQGVVYYSIFVSATVIRLATTLANALAGTAVTFSSNGSGTNTVNVFTNNLGLFKGEETHLQTASEVGPHNHPGINGESFWTTGNTGFALGFAGIATATFRATTADNAGGIPFNVMQPTTYMNVFIKL